MPGLEKLDAWRLARLVARSAYRLSLGSSLKSHFALTDQIRRCALSIPANICEGYALGTRAQLVRHLRIALGSAFELRCHVDLAADLNLITASQAGEVQQNCIRTISVLVGLLKHLGARVPG
jgi:four helix bundle protein